YFSGIKERLEKINANQVAVDDNGLMKKVLGGGTDLYVQQHDSMVNEDMSFLLDNKDFKGISLEGRNCRLGGASTVTDIYSSEIFRTHFPALGKFIKLVSSTQIRNMATIAGNFVNASPIGDFSIFFLALNARLLLTDGNQKRIIPLRDFYKGYKLLDKLPGENIESFEFELPSANDKFNFEKVSKRTCLDIASVNTAMHISIKNDIITSASISAGGVGPVPMYLSAASAFLTGKQVSGELIDSLLEIVQSEISPISDARGTEKYKRLLLSQLIKAHFMNFFPAMDLKKLLAA
ncbi:MAG: FAD binding domain-containing protein, partial [Ferruginibacter sp.]